MSDVNTIEPVDDPAEDELLRIYEDADSPAIFDELFNPADGIYDSERDQDRRKACIEKLMAKGYSSAAAAAYLDDNLDVGGDDDEEDDDDN